MSVTASSVFATRPAPDESAAFYAGYIARVPDGDIRVTLATEGEHTVALLRTVDAERAAHRYAPEKWSVAEVVGHVIDAERVFAYRLLRVARGDATPLPGFDENAYVAHSRADARPIADLVAEWRTVRAATRSLLEGLGADAALRRGTASGHPVSARALAWIIAGHERHHRTLLVDRYGLRP